MKNKLFISGKTSDERFVVSGSQFFVGSTGCPLTLVLEHFKEKNLQIDWFDYILDATKEGARMQTIISNILDAVSQVYGPKSGTYIKITEVLETIKDY